MAKWLAKEFDWDTGRYTGNYYDIAEAGIVAKFVDSFYGDDTAAGTAAAPFKTLSKAITTLNSTGANGSRIFMNGIFSETLPTQTYWYHFIGCGGGRFGRTLLWYNDSLGTRVVFSKPNTRVENITTLNYELQTLCTISGGIGSDFYNLNCFIINAELSFSNGGSVYSYFSRFYNLFHSRQNLRHRMYSTIVINYDGTPGQPLYLYGSNSYVKNIILTGNISNSLISSITDDIEAQFINELGLDWNVRITSPLISAGIVDENTGIAANVGGVEVGLPYNGITPEFTTEGGATITDLTIDANGKITITSPATTGTLETALMDLGNIYPLENIDLFNVFDFLSGEITQGVFETFSSPRMALTIKLKYGLTSAEVDDCPWLLIEYGKQPTYSGTGASRVGNAADTFDPDTFQTITCRYMKLFITLQNNS